MSASLRRLAYVEWSGMAEPGDAAAGWLVEQLGPVAAREWVKSVVANPVEATLAMAPHAPAAHVDALIAAARAWNERSSASGGAQAHLERAHAVGARAVTRVDPEWPRALDDLGAAAPYCLWVRGAGQVAALWQRSLAIVGSRASTAYGDYVTAEIAGQLADVGWCIVSGGAFGIDARAHAAALDAGGVTIAVMAGGVDRLYPAANDALLVRCMEQGTVMSEVPPGFAPFRSRFLTRNRVIASARATVVVEAALRSGALSSARHAAELLRPVGAVPGPVTSAASAGCHALLRDGAAVCVTDARDVLELVGPLGGADVGDGAAAAGKADGQAPPRLEFADPRHRCVYDALRPRGSIVADLVRDCALPIGDVRAALGGLQLAGLAQQDGERWRKRAASLSA